jgi:peroxiredoxin
MNIDTLQVQDLNGDAQLLGEVRGNRAGVIVLVRHFGCIFCRQRLAELVAESTPYPDSEYAVWVIGNGTALMAQDFVETYAITRPVFTDPSRKIYKALGMNRNFGINLTTLKQSFVAFKQGHRQTDVQGDPWQQGGVVVFDRAGVVNFSIADNEAGSEIPWKTVWKYLPAASTESKDVSNA